MGISEKSIVELSESECWARLGTQRVGRLVTSVGEVIDVVPINFVVDGKSVVFRTAAGSKLVELTINSSVLFEVDEFDESEGWSVVVRGDARAIESETEIASVEKLPLTPFVSTLKPTFVRVEVEGLTGRAFEFGPEPRREDQQEG
ncbi:pyridoxamine 5'-phosphate oxidase family protein [Leucobacter sp. wl10]|uniref:pyridoxamine 5'-phosphate oxidase family protein n=1 Tax=Leucobacter sp. wl10 TaxID=2304677 RepID=UPI000E5B65FE|nr:pyridoxamine 5'-phosphate oxidase family protein [Leucobacter sp. wl10]RGE16838.1 pyridoxamine 5'-phosphate oxidase family protein [Leucobacter sp. wl10]